MMLSTLLYAQPLERLAQEYKLVTALHNNNLKLAETLLQQRAIGTPNTPAITNRQTSEFFYQYNHRHTVNQEVLDLFLKYGLYIGHRSNRKTLVLDTLQSDHSCKVVERYFNVKASKEYGLSTSFSHVKMGVDNKYSTAYTIETPLTYALKNNRCLELFDTFTPFLNYDLILYSAIVSGNLHWVKKIIDLGADYKSPYRVLETPSASFLFDALPHPKILEYLLKKGLKPDFQLLDVAKANHYREAVLLLSPYLSKTSKTEILQKAFTENPDLSYQKFQYLDVNIILNAKPEGYTQEFYIEILDAYVVELKKQTRYGLKDRERHLLHKLEKKIYEYYEDPRYLYSRMITMKALLPFSTPKEKRALHNEIVTLYDMYEVYEKTYYDAQIIRDYLKHNMFNTSPDLCSAFNYFVNENRTNELLLASYRRSTQMTDGDRYEVDVNNNHQKETIRYSRPHSSAPYVSLSIFPSTSAQALYFNGNASSTSFINALSLKHKDDQAYLKKLECGFDIIHLQDKNYIMACEQLLEVDQAYQVHLKCFRPRN